MVAALTDGDERAVRYLFFDHYDALLRRNAERACGGRRVEFDDLRQELYLFLSADQWARLRRYDPQLPFECWFSVVSYRFFRDYARRTQPPHITLSADSGTLSTAADSGTPPNAAYAHRLSHDIQFSTIAGIDLRTALSRIPLSRDRQILEALFLDDEPPAAVAARHHLTIANLYNLKRRALSRLIQQSLQEYRRDTNLIGTMKI